MSTLEKTIGLLNTMSEKQIEIVYLYAQFLESQEKKYEKPKESVEDIVNGLVGCIKDEGMSLEEYREERIAEKYGIVD